MTRAFILPAALAAFALAAPSAAAAQDTLANDAKSAAYEMGEIAQAADGAFGEASEGVAKVIEKVFADLGKPNAYIVGREGGGALIVGLRYGKGTLHSKVEGARTVLVQVRSGGLFPDQFNRRELNCLLPM